MPLIARPPDWVQALARARCLGVEPHHLIDPPLRQHAGKILALVRAAAFPARARGHGDRARDHEHVAQVEPFQPAEIESPPGRGRPFAERALHLCDRSQRAGELGLGTERADLVGHDPLQLLDHRGGVDLARLSVCARE